MKRRMNRFTLGALSLVLLCTTAAIAADSAKVAVLNPRGVEPPIRLIPIAPRPDTLDGKTIYIVDTNYPLTEPFVKEIPKVMAARYPNTNWIYKKKVGSYFDDDPKLWAEIKEKAHGMIMAIGH